MNTTLIAGAHQMAALEQWQASIAHNLANSSTAGYQANTFQVKAGRPRAIQQTESSASVQTFLPMGSLHRAIQPGPVRVTDNPYDMAIQGDGFFAVRDPKGQTLYTRDGEFHRDANGTLVNKLGYPVLASGSPIEIDPNQGPVTVARDGTLSQNGQPVAQISVFTFANPEALQQGNGSYLVDVDGTAGAQPAANASVLQYQLEGSAVSPLTEMVNMISVARSYELTQKLIQEDTDRHDRILQTFSVQ